MPLLLIPREVIVAKRHPCGRISIPVIYLVATRTSLLGPRPDPMLWFCLMLMPTGPPAIKLTALADVNGSEEGEKLAVAKFLTVSLLSK